MKHKNISDKISLIRKSVLVKDIMSRDVVSLDQNLSVFKAVKIMSKHSISTIVILDKKKPVGIVTERDLVKKLILKEKDPKKTKIIEIMSKNPAEIKPNITIRKASNIMRSKNIRHLIVTDVKNNIIGLISQRDIVKSMNKIYDSYRSLLWNPVFAIFLFLMVIVLFLINFFVFRQ